MAHPEDQPQPQPFSESIPASELPQDVSPKPEYLDLDRLSFQPEQPAGQASASFNQQPGYRLDPEVLEMLSAKERERLQACKERFSETYHLYGRMISSYARRACGNSYLTSGQTNEDITQEVWEAYWKQVAMPGKTFEHPAQERAWLFRVTKRRLIDQYRGSYRGIKEVPTEIIEDPPEHMSFEEEYGALLSHGMATRIQFARDILRTLSGKQREILWRAYEWKQTRTEIFEDMDTLPSVGATRVELSRAKRCVLNRFVEEQIKYGLDTRNNEKDLPGALAELLGRIMLLEDPLEGPANL